MGGTDRVDATAFLGLHDFLELSYPKAHTALEREVIGDYSLLYTWPGADPSLNPILLNAHLDVTPVEPATEDDWTYPPFAGTVADGFVWGRGVMDIKVSLMGIMEAVEYLVGNGFTPERTIYLAFGHDEEVGGLKGAGRITELLEWRGVRLDFSLDEGMVIAHDIVPGVAKPVALIGVTEKGYLTLELTANGDGGHSSRPPKGTTISALARAIFRLEANQMPATMSAPVPEMFDHLAPEMPFDWQVALANRWLLEPLILSRLADKPSTNAGRPHDHGADDHRGRYQGKRNPDRGNRSDKHPHSAGRHH